MRPAEPVLANAVTPIPVVPTAGSTQVAQEQPTGWNPPGAVVARQAAHTAPPPQQYAAPVTDSKADAAFVLGILSIFLNVLFVPGVLAIVWGGRERNDNSKARTGFICGIIGTAISGLVALLFIVILASAGSAVNSLNNGSRSAPTAGNPRAGIPASPRKATYNVGDSASTGDFKVTVYGFTNPQPPANEFMAPTAGMHYVSVDVQMTNPDSTDQHAFSSLLGFHLLDDQNHQYNEDLFGAGLTPGPPDGEIVAGQSIRGNVAFEVPDGASGLKLRVQGGLTAAGAVFNLA